MTFNELSELAGKHAQRNPSAYFCYRDAMALSEAGEGEMATIRMVKSMQYSVGIFHDDYEKAIIGLGIKTKGLLVWSETLQSFV